MKYLFLLLSFVFNTAYATPVINLQYSDYVLTGEKVIIDASTSTDSNGLDLIYEWELMSRPEGSQAQYIIESGDGEVISLVTDREGIYSFRLKVINGNGEVAVDYPSIYTKNSAGDIVYGPETRSVDFLCKITFGFFGCDTENFQFDITSPEDSYSLIIQSNNIDRGIFNINDEQIVNYADHTGGSDLFVKEISLQTNNTISADMIATNLDGSYTVTVVKQNLPVDSNPNEPTANDIGVLAISGIETIVQFAATDLDGDDVSYKILKEPFYGTYELNNSGELKYTARTFDERIEQIIVSARDNGTPNKESIFRVFFQITTNQPPIIFAENMSSNTETVVQTLTILDDPTQVLTKTVSRNPNNGIVIFDSNLNTVTYLSNAGFIGTDSFEITVRDNGPFNLATTQEITVQVFPNTIPQFSGTTNFTLQENTIQQFEMRATDPDPLQQLTTTITQQPANGTIQLLNGFDYVYSPNEDFFGNDSIVVEFRDNANPNGVVTATYNFEVLENGNNPPVFNGFIDKFARNDFSPIQMELFLSEVPTDSNGVEKIVWHYGDGNSKEVYLSVTNQNANGYNVHSYAQAGEYNVSVEIHDTLGAIKFYSETVYITSDKKPVAKIVPSVYSGSAPLTVNFDASSSHDHGETDPANIIYFWNFGGGDTQNGNNLTQISKTFNTAGVYEVYLDVIDGSIRRSARTIKIYVDEPVNELNPQIVLNSDVISGSAPLTVNFDASESIDAFGNNTNLTYKWNMQNLESADSYKEGSNVSYTFSKSGSYEIELKVTDDSGNESVEYKTIYVDNPNYNDFDFVFLNKIGLQVIASMYPFFDHTPISDRSIVIDWGDGNKNYIGKGIWFDHTYAANGTYNVTMTAELASGQIVTKTKTIIVEDTTLIPSFDLIPSEYSFVVPFDNTYSLENPSYSEVVDVTWLLASGEVHTGTSTTDNSYQYSHSVAGVDHTEAIVTLPTGFSTLRQVAVGASNNDIPFLNYNIGQCVGKAPFTTTVSAFNKSSDPFNSINWFFGTNGNLFGGNNVSIEFNDAGRLFPLVYAKTANDNFNIEGFPIQVNSQDPPVGNQTPTISYVAFFDAQNPNVMSLSLDNSNDPDGEIICYQISLDNGDSFTSRGFNRYEFPNTGTYNMTIAAFDNWGASTTQVFPITVGVNSGTNEINNVEKKDQKKFKYQEYIKLRRESDLKKQKHFQALDRRSRGQ